MCADRSIFRFANILFFNYYPIYSADPDADDTVSALQQLDAGYLSHCAGIRAGDSATPSVVYELD